MVTGPGAGPAAAGDDPGPSAGAGAVRATKEGGAEATTPGAAQPAALTPSAPTGAAAERVGAVGGVAATYPGEAQPTRYAGVSAGAREGGRGAAATDQAARGVSSPPPGAAAK